MSVLLGNGDGTFQPQVTYAVGSIPAAIVAGDFTGDGRLDLAVANSGYDNDVSMLLGNGDGTFQTQVTYAVGSVPSRHRGGRLHRRRPPRPGRRQLRLDNDVSVLLGNGDGTFQPQVTYAVGSAQTPSWRATSTATASSTWPSPTQASNDVSVLLGNGDGTFVDPGQFATTPHATPLVADVNGDGTDDVLVVDGAGNILYRQGIPGQPGTFEPPVTVNPEQSPRATSPGCRTPIKARCSPASTPRTTRSRSTPTATAASSGSARSPPASSRRRSSRPT